VAITVEEVRQRLQLEWRLIVFMFNHGGGWVLGDFPTHERFVGDPVSEPGAAAVLGVGVAGSRIQFRVVFQQAVKHDGSFPQRARDGLLVKPQAVGVTCSSGEKSSPLATASHWVRPGDFPPPSHHANLRTQIPEPRLND